MGEVKHFLFAQLLHNVHTAIEDFCFMFVSEMCIRSVLDPPTEAETKVYKQTSWTPNGFDMMLLAK